MTIANVSVPSQDIVHLALEKIGLSHPMWQTLVLAAVQDVPLPSATIWNTWTDLATWPMWSKPLVTQTRWLSNAEWQVGAKFEQVLHLGFPLGTQTSQETVRSLVPGQQVMWWKDEKGIKSCHIWDFQQLADSSTRITNVEVFHGVAMGIVKPLVAKRLQHMFETSVRGLAQQAQQRA